MQASDASDDPVKLRIGNRVEANSMCASAIRPSVFQLRAHGMSRREKLVRRVLYTESDAGIRFDELRLLLRSFGFEERIRGSHHIFHRGGLPEILNLQPRGWLAKPYQVRQVRALFRRHGIAR